MQQLLGPAVWRGVQPPGECAGAVLRHQGGGGGRGRGRGDLGQEDGEEGPGAVPPVCGGQGEDAVLRVRPPGNGGDSQELAGGALH